MSADLPTAVIDKASAAGLQVRDTIPVPSKETVTYPYVVVFFDSGVRTSDREGDIRVRREHGWYTTTVGTSTSQVRAALERLTGAWEDWAPTVDGRSCSKIEHDSIIVRPDTSLADRTLFIATDQWRAVSDPL